MMRWKGLSGNGKTWMDKVVIFAMFCGCRCLQRRAKRLASNVLEAVPIGAGTYLDGKCFVWLRQKFLKSVRIPASFFLARQKFFSPICTPSPIGTASYFRALSSEIRHRSLTRQEKNTEACRLLVNLHRIPAPYLLKRRKFSKNLTFSRLALML